MNSDLLGALFNLVLADVELDLIGQEDADFLTSLMMRNDLGEVVLFTSRAERQRIYEIARKAKGHIDERWADAGLREKLEYDEGMALARAMVIEEGEWT